jgi:hypothetical protein
MADDGGGAQGHVGGAGGLRRATRPDKHVPRQGAGRDVGAPRCGCPHQLSDARRCGWGTSRTGDPAQHRDRLLGSGARSCDSSCLSHQDLRCPSSWTRHIAALAQTTNGHDKARLQRSARAYRAFDRRRRACNCRPEASTGAHGFASEVCPTRPAHFYGQKPGGWVPTPSASGEQQGSVSVRLRVRSDSTLRERSPTRTAPTSISSPSVVQRDAHA